MKNKGLWTTGYAFLNVMYFAAFCTLHAYAAVFLLSRDFSNTEVGILLATANITSAIFQPFIASIIDKGRWLTNRRFIMIACAIILAGSFFLRMTHSGKAVIFAVFAMIYMIQFAYQPTMTAMCFEYQKMGCDIYYGLARGLGSAGFAVTSVFIGRAAQAHGASILMSATSVIMLVSLVAAFFFRPAAASSVSATEKVTKKTDEKTGKMAAFFRNYPAFLLFVIATVCLFFAHNMLNDFMIQIIRSLGGGESELGYASFLQAILELPVMALIGIVLKKVSPSKLLVFSGIAFFIKILILVFANNLVWLFISQGFQLFAYAVFIPASAYYVSTYMADYDQVKGQAYITSAITIGGVFSNLASGVILDNLGMKPMLITGSAVCFAGVLISFAAERKQSDAGHVRAD